MPADQNSSQLNGRPVTASNQQAGGGGYTYRSTHTLGRQQEQLDEDDVGGEAARPAPPTRARGFAGRGTLRAGAAASRETAPGGGAPPPRSVRSGDYIGQAHDVLRHGLRDVHPELLAAALEDFL